MLFLEERFELVREKNEKSDSSHLTGSFGCAYILFLRKDTDLFYILNFIDNNLNLFIKNKYVNCIFLTKNNYKEIYNIIISDFLNEGSNVDEEFLDKYLPLKEVFDIFFKKYLKGFNDRKLCFYDYKTSSTVIDELKKIYKNENILDRYELFKVQNHHLIFNNELNYLSDESNGKHLILSVTKDTLEVINKIRMEEFSEDISLKISDIYDVIPLNEEVLRGSFFDYHLNELPDISIFYNINEQDQKLYVFVEKEKNKISLTFETLVPDLTMDKDGNVLTNLIHLEVTKDEINNSIISHIDHEYIIYSAGEYDARYDNNPKQRGHDKIKTFKIDNAKIPLNYTIDGAPILYCFLVSCLDNKELIDEYFNNVINRVNI